MQEAITRLIKLGVPPDDYIEDNGDIPDEWLMEFDNIIKSIQQPVTWEEAAVIVTHFPQNTLYEMEWALIHRFESVLSYNNPEFKSGDAVPQRYLDLVRTCNSAYVKNILLERCDIKEDGAGGNTK